MVGWETHSRCSRQISKKHLNCPCLPDNLKSRRNSHCLTGVFVIPLNVLVPLPSLGAQWEDIMGAINELVNGSKSALLTLGFCMFPAGVALFPSFPSAVDFIPLSGDGKAEAVVASIDPNALISNRTWRSMSSPTLKRKETRAKLKNKPPAPKAQRPRL